ncbi:MAG: shikimate kinase [Planctomycetota bacterium]
MSSSGLVLIGARGAGKTTVGERLASRLGLRLLDTDTIVETETGRGIDDLLGDGSFRAEEERVLARVLAGPPAVVAAGGGAVLWSGFLRAARGWKVIWLDAAPEVLARRIRRDAHARPSLTGRPADVEVGGVARERAHLYAAAASQRIDTTELTADAVVDRIENLLREEGNPGGR